MASPAEVYESLRQAHAKADADAAAALYAPDGVYFEPDNVPHRGRDEIRTYLASYFANRAGRRSSGVPGVSVVEVGGDGITYHRDFQ